MEIKMAVQTTLGVFSYHLRINTMEKKEVIIKDILEAFTDTYLIAFEVTHYHILFKTTCGTLCKRESIARKTIKAFGLVGNEQYSLKLCRNIDQTAKYICKCGEYTFKGYPEAYIARMAKCSFKKGKAEFSKELRKLEEEYITDLINLCQFTNLFVKLKVSYGHNLYGRQIEAYIKTMKCRKHGHSAISEYAERILSNIDRFS